MSNNNNMYPIAGSNSRNPHVANFPKNEYNDAEGGASVNAEKLYDIIYQNVQNQETRARDMEQRLEKRNLEAEQRSREMEQRMEQRSREAEDRSREMERRMDERSREIAQRMEERATATEAHSREVEARIEKRHDQIMKKLETIEEKASSSSKATLAIALASMLGIAALVVAVLVK